MKNTTTAQDHAYYRKKFWKSAQAILNFNDSGLSILEISHQQRLWPWMKLGPCSELLGLEGKGYQALFRWC
jgi:phosphoserine aminotransferase